MISPSAQKLYDLLVGGVEKRRSAPKRILQHQAVQYSWNWNYIVQSYVFDEHNIAYDYRRRFYKHTDPAQRFAFLERVKGREVDVFDIKNKEFI